MDQIQDLMISPKEELIAVMVPQAQREKYSDVVEIDIENINWRLVDMSQLFLDAKLKGNNGTLTLIDYVMGNPKIERGVLSIGKSYRLPSRNFSRLDANLKGFYSVSDDTKIVILE
jgi:hypothetical protein